jgi:hypothetical protein
LENLEEIDKSLETYDHSKFNQEHINHLSRSIRSSEIEAGREYSRKEKSRT